MGIFEELQVLIQCYVMLVGVCSVGDVFVVLVQVLIEMQYYVLELIFVVVVQGVKCVLLGEEMFEYCGGQFFVVGVDLFIVGGVIEVSFELFYFVVGLMLQVVIILLLLLEMDLVDMIVFEFLGYVVSDVLEELLDMVVCLLWFKDFLCDVVVLGLLVQCELVWWLFYGM